MQQMKTVYRALLPTSMVRRKNNKHLVNEIKESIEKINVISLNC